MHGNVMCSALVTGVANSITSDIDNLVNLMSLFNVFPKGLYVNELVKIAKAELALECDYTHEARCQREYKARMNASDSLRDIFAVPDVIPELSARRVITGEWMEGVAIDQIKQKGQEVRDRVGTALLSLTLQARHSLHACSAAAVYA
jgi:aarF domain-containing kinase